ncbi:SDR family NAD(P)-dependent oxidoreductase [Parasalinivibrio latis]|uniref:SDR family NAD(P)-dependent oxidoreductase n=1 Tax=Parasalinivibrio latis TaxID=2952610 RepID=UPI0030E3A374
MKIADSVIMITAATSPTGSTLARHFSAMGAKLILVDRNNSELQLLHEACRHNGVQCFALTMEDISSAQIDLLFETVKHYFGTIDVLFNLWQMDTVPGLLESANSDDCYHALADTMVIPYRFSRQAAITMRDSGRKGVIVNLAADRSTASAWDLENACALLQSFTQRWAEELSPASIRVGAVMPARRLWHSPKELLSSAMDYEISQGAEYIVENDSFTGRLLEAESD